MQLACFRNFKDQTKEQSRCLMRRRKANPKVPLVIHPAHQIPNRGRPTRNQGLRIRNLVPRSRQITASLAATVEPAVV
jgi:hypothetical protein